MSELTAKALSDSRSFENAILERDMRMKKAGWIVAALAGLLLVVALAALILLLPLKTTTVRPGASSASPPSARTSWTPPRCSISRRLRPT